MKKLIIGILSLIATGVAVYFLFEYTNFSSLNGIESVLFFSVLALTAITVVLFFAFFTRKTTNKVKWLENRLDSWNKTSYHINKAGDEVFNELPIAIIVYDDDFEIKWANRYAKSVFQNKLLEKSIESVSRELNQNVFEKKEKFNIEFLNDYYEVIHNPDSKLLYLFNVTERELLNKKYHERVPAIGVIIVDNLEDSIKRFDIQEKSNIRGQYLGEVADWAAQFNAYLKSFDDDRFIMLMDRDSLDSMIEDKFSILDRIREISNKSHLRATLSVGVACFDLKTEELGNYAQRAVDLAEKRGGDQAVVNIQNQKIQYFGAKVNALEKNSLVGARVQTSALKDLVEGATNVYIMGHNAADCDCLGAMIGTYRLIESSNKNTAIICDKDHLDFTSRKFFNELETKSYETTKFFVNPSQVTDINRGSLLIVVDSQSPKLVMYPELLSRFKTLALIDHHRRGEISFEDVTNEYVETSVSSSVELITEMFAFYAQEIKLTPFEATIMLAGIVVDTNNFTFRVGIGTFEASATLKNLGADMIDVRAMLREDIESQVAISTYVSNVEIMLNRFGLVTIPEDTIINDRAFLAKVSEQALNIDGVAASFTIARISENTVGISARSYRDINVQLIMEEMGGGGHLNSSAVQIQDTPIEEVKNQLITILRRDFENAGEEKMKIILLEDVKGRGTKDEIIEVASGYGNYLISNKKGILATDEAIKNLEDAKREQDEQKAQHLKLMQKLKEEIETKSVNLYIKIGNDGKIFGSITSKQVCEEFEAQTGIHIDKKKVVLPSQINSVGIYTANVTLAPSVVANIEINVLEK